MKTLIEAIKLWVKEQLSWGNVADKPDVYLPDSSYVVNMSFDPDISYGYYDYTLRDIILEGKYQYALISNSLCVNEKWNCRYETDGSYRYAYIYDDSNAYRIGMDTSTDYKLTTSVSVWGPKIGRQEGVTIKFYNPKATKIDDAFASEIGNEMILKMNVENPTGVGSLSIGREVNSAIGEHSVALGYSTIASGAQSYAEGNNTSASGISSHAEGDCASAAGEYSHAEGYNTSASGISSHAEGYNTKATGRYSHAEGNDTTASGWYAHAEGSGTIASDAYSHAEGCSTQATAGYSHAEGRNTTASGNHSHAEGYNTKASGACSHTEGYHTSASDIYAHAEGLETTASGGYSHAEGYSTIASGVSSHVQGKCNIEDTEERYAHIVGNGTSSTSCSNAHTLDWNGNAWFAGDVYVGGTSQDDAKKLCTADDAMPAVTSADNGKMLVVEGGTWAVKAFTELPAVTQEDNGKVFMVTNGQWAVGTLEDVTLTPYAEEVEF